MFSFDTQEAHLDLLFTSVTYHFHFLFTEILQFFFQSNDGFPNTIKTDRRPDSKAVCAFKRRRERLEILKQRFDVYIIYGMAGLHALWSILYFKWNNFSFIPNEQTLTFSDNQQLGMFSYMYYTSCCFQLSSDLTCRKLM